MLTAIVPEALNHSSCVSVVPPFDYTPFYITSPFRDLLVGEDGTFSDQLAFDFTRDVNFLYTWQCG